MHAYEKLGVFYLGRRYDLDQGHHTGEPLLYDSRDLVTHGVCVGMTGSGKTGLCVSLLEEAALDGIPALAIDPKGDLGNLLLTFPDLDAADFLPWVNQDDARRKGLSAEAFAAREAETWRQGLAAWDQDGERIRRLREAAEFLVYTPGSDAGLPVSILASFAAPPPEVVDDADIFRDRIATTASSLLGLMGINADPVRSREHILISTLLDAAWRAGEDLDLGALIHRIQSPPMSRVGVMEMESFFPERDRSELAVALNNLLAAPTFAGWLSGEPLDIDRILYSAEGRPRIAVFSIAHLPESERIFFVALLLNQLVTWMRTRPGTSSLRALLYMDEIFGYMPPVAEPPSKRPLLTLLKQARAYGVGVLLATQNPVDLDYKGLSNAGTWFLGRLQTERDKARVLDGLEGASARGGMNRAAMEAALSSLGKRVFLMNNVHDDAPSVFQTRWAMSYLRGPLTRTQIASLMAPVKRAARAASTPAETDAPPPPAPAAPAADRAPAPAATRPRPVLPPSIREVFLPSEAATPPGIYRPRLLAVADVDCVDTRKGAADTQEIVLLAEIPGPNMSVDWKGAARTPLREQDLHSEPAPDTPFAELPNDAAKVAPYRSWSKSLRDHLYRTCRASALYCDALGQASQPKETEREFRIRLAEGLREARDTAKDELRERYEPKLHAVRERMRRAEQAVERERDQSNYHRGQAMISLGNTVLGTLFGRRRSATTAMRGMGRAARQAADVRRAEENVEAVRRDIERVERELQTELADIESRFDPLRIELTEIELKPRRTDVNVRFLALAWSPESLLPSP